MEGEVSAGPSTVPGGRREDRREADWRLTHRENLGRELQGELLHNCGSLAYPTWPCPGYPGCPRTERLKRHGLQCLFSELYMHVTKTQYGWSENIVI